MRRVRQGMAAAAGMAMADVGSLQVGGGQRLDLGPKDAATARAERQPSGLEQRDYGFDELGGSKRLDHEAVALALPVFVQP